MHVRDLLVFSDCHSAHLLNLKRKKMQVQQLKKSAEKKTGELKGAEQLEGEETNECICMASQQQNAWAKACTFVCIYE